MSYGQRVAAAMTAERRLGLSAFLLRKLVGEAGPKKLQRGSTHNTCGMSKVHVPALDILAFRPTLSGGLCHNHLKDTMQMS